MKKNKGITLVALVVTIIVLLILAGVTMTMVIGNNGIFTRVEQAKRQTNESQELEVIQLAVVEAETNNMIDDTNLKEELEKSVNNLYQNSKVEELGEGYVITLENENQYLVKENGKTEKIPLIEVTLEDGNKVNLTKDNFGMYLGKIVKNYKTNGSEYVTETNMQVSKMYRLYYIDFEDKYGDGVGTIFLRAEPTTSARPLLQDGSEETSKVKKLNPSLYKEGVTPPAVTNANMQSVIWLTDIAKWEELKTSGEGTEIGNKVNYVVGAPSVEMMMDSYNAYYNLKGETPDYTEIPAAPDQTRKKLFYKYVSGEYGYLVGPDNNNSAEYGDKTSDNSVKTDSKIDSMYFPGANKYYWLASPATNSSEAVINVHNTKGGSVIYTKYYGGNWICPLVSVKPDAILKLGD